VERDEGLAPTPQPGDDDYAEAYVPSPDDFAPSAPRPVSPLSGMPPRRAARPAIAGFLLFFAVSLPYWRWGDSAGFWASREAVFGQHQWWRLLTALFTHANVEHVLSNAPLFLIFGWFLYAYFGFRAFPLASLVVGVLSNAATLYFYPPQTTLVGASGMLYGMVALWLVLYVRFETAFSVPMRIFRAIGVSILLLFPTTFQASTSYLAHATGFVIGVAVGFAMLPFARLVAEPPPAARQPRVMVVAAPPPATMRSGSWTRDDQPPSDWH
jgi:membrane associated rhomboid family serine protease